MHQAVLLEEVMDVLLPREGRVIIDGTLGGGGHAEALLRHGATVIGVDWDCSAVAISRARLSPFNAQFRAVEGTLSEVIQRLGAPVDGILLDLGVSTLQLDAAARGFSFRHDGPLDMRMGAARQTAAQLIDELSVRELAQLIATYGEERFFQPIARSLKERRPRTTYEAVEVVKNAVPRKAWPKRIHVATRTFQALRIAVNDEFNELQRSLAALPDLLKSGGRAAIISFHSLEDRQVKQTFRTMCAKIPGTAPDQLSKKAYFIPLTKKPLRASQAELQRNPRARSARLRAVEKIQCMP